MKMEIVYKQGEIQSYRYQMKYEKMINENNHKNLINA